MSYILSSTTIRSPSNFNVSTDTQVAQNRTLDGTIARDYFGLSKQKWTLSYRNVNSTDFTTIDDIYQTYLTTANTVTFESTEANYIVTSTAVHVDLITRNFGIKGSDYLSDFDLVLTEA